MSLTIHKTINYGQFKAINQISIYGVSLNKSSLNPIGSMLDGMKINRIP